MQNNSKIKEKIINTTIALIGESDGLVEKITVREIAGRSNIAVGLINYHFGSKRHLIEICIQRIISQVMKTFSETNNSFADIVSFTVSVFSFLLNNAEISKISMLSDLSQPDTESNSSVSYQAICQAILGEEAGNIKKIKAFMLLATIQSAFLNRNISAALLGLDLNDRDGYETFFGLVTEILGIK